LCALGEIARRTGRRLCLLGRSLCRHADVARAVGKLDWPSDLVVAPEIAATLPRTAVLFLATGTQAEPRGALARLASGQHGDVRLEPGDLVVLSSRTIPGSERLVHDMCDRFLRSGVELCTAANEPAIHVSGHAHRGEQARMIELTRPRAFVPLHGTVYHLHEHAKLAQTLGVPDSLVLVDGERAALAPDGLARLSSVTSGKVAIAGGRAIPEQALRERRKLAKSGVVFVALSYHVDGAIEVGASATGIGDEQLVIEAAVSAARAAARGLESRAHVEAIEGVRRAVRQRLSERTGQRPMIEVQLTRRGQP
jgi:ribonuclease J